MSSERYDFGEIEKKWQKVWQENRTYEPDLDNPKGKGPFYNLMMFPYPSAEGLHVGNMYAFTGADIYGRKKRMEGYDVFEPIGLDGFGIHSENYALKIGAHPMEQAKISEARFYDQLSAIGNGFAREERLETYDPAYYRWTQWIFVQMWKHGLAYRKKQAVNWCPSCKTVLADEQVIGGKCERCGTAVEVKELEQWFFRITKYAERLLDNLEKIDWSERVKIAQKNWIGKSEGASIKFPISDFQFSDEIEVFTTRPDTLFGATFIVVSPELAKEWMEKGWQPSQTVAEYVDEALARRAEGEEKQKEKTGVATEIFAANPANKEKIPVWISDYVLAGYGTGAIMAVPAHDKRDYEFAQKFNLPVVMVVCPHYPAPTCPVLDEAYEGEGHLVGSGVFDGMKSEEAKWKIAEVVGGKRETRFRLRDWLISRQRYWGAPIPMIFCEACAAAGKGEQSEMSGWYAVPEEELPVKLPYIEKFRPEGGDESPLGSAPEFYKTKCPGCGGDARRETDVSDTFLDSAWYYIRYPSTRATRLGQAPWDPVVTKQWFPVHLYTGGAEHAVLHLLYVRFVALALHDLKLLAFGSSDAPGGEPFPKFRAHGLLIKEGAKMSKSKGNVVNPDEYIKKYGADVLRMYLMFLAPFEQGGDFRDASIQGIVRFVRRIRELGLKIPPSGITDRLVSVGGMRAGIETPTLEKRNLEKTLHKTIRAVTNDIENLHYNTAISALMVILGYLEREKDNLGAWGVFSPKGIFETFIKLLAPFAPHLAEELWHELGHEDSIHRTPWPSYEESLIAEDTFPLVVQVDGKHRATVMTPRGIVKEQAEALVRADAKVISALGVGGVKKVVYVEDRLINFVTK
ncbi:MAG: leucine--tRNA ligase [Candidatus Brennerbacteria bacterium]|nr:leucine--tRNA ligase [Candidatus Brennerbacteria bacterium]